MKKFLITLTLVISAMLCLSLNAFALTDGDWEFKLLDNEVIITGYNGSEKNVVIPSHIFNTPVTAVDGSNMFPSAVTLTFPDSVSKICPYLCVRSGSNTTLETVILPEGLRVIEANAFHNCKALKNIVLPSTLTNIKGGYYEGAFQGCESLEKINFPANLVEIGRYAFEGTGLTEIDMTASTKLESIGSCAFSRCGNLKKVKLGYGLKSTSGELFSYCSSLTDVELPTTLTSLANNTFWNCTSLEYIVLPTSLKSIGEFAFCGCTSLKEVVVPYGTETISSGAFQSCPSLRSVYVPDTVTKTPSSSLMNGSDNAIVYCSANSKMAEYCKKKEVSYLTDNSVNSGITVLYNGTRISFHAYGQNPALLQSRTLVPLRSIFEAMGAEVQWDSASSTAIATRDGITVKIQIGANEINKNGQSIPVDVPAQLLNDRTMVPARVIAEAFGANVAWNQSGQTVLITE